MGAFCEDSRVKFPTLMHLMGMGYKYISQRGLFTKYVTIPKTESDTLTNILLQPFSEAYLRLNPLSTQDDADAMLHRIQKSLNNDDLGRQFYKEILLDTTNKIIDLSSPTNFIRNNTFQVATEMTCGDLSYDNFRPDITIFINGLPLAFIEVKKENNHEGVDAERKRMKTRFTNPCFRRFLNITQIMVFSNDMEYDEQLKQGAYYATIGKTNTLYNCFREEGQNSFPIQKRYHPVTPEDEEILLRDNNVPQYKNNSDYKTNCKAETPTKRLCESLFSFERFYFFLRYGIAYVDHPNGLQKHVMRYPQVFATKAIERHLDKGEQKGIIWHTQGSGKTALAYFNVKYLTDYYSQQGIVPQFFFIVDRIDLLEQAQKEFTRRGLKVNPVQSKEDFAKLIKDGVTTQNKEGKLEITVVNIHKFSKDSRALAKNAYNVKVKRIYFIDEAHRNYNPEGSFLKNLIASDENAIKIALTGTPIIGEGYNTKDIFGDYIHTYYYNASISDGYTLRLIREDIGSNFKITMKEALNSIRVIYLCFFQHLLYSLKDTGKGAIVVPTGFITAKSGIAFKIRKHLVDNKILKGVVSMPSNVFANTGTNVSVVFIDKNKTEKPVFIDASKLGETIKIGKNQKTNLRSDEIAQIVDTFRNEKVVEQFSVTPSYEEVAEKGYSFSAGQYFDIKIEYVDITEEEFKRRMADYEKTLTEQFAESHRLENEIIAQLKTLKFNQ